MINTENTEDTEKFKQGRMKADQRLLRMLGVDQPLKNDSMPVATSSSMPSLISG